MASHKVIISCAVTGSIHTPSMSPHLPVTSAEIAESALGAAAAGAAIVHLHARNPVDGRPDQSPEAFEPFLRVIKQSSNVVVNLTTGGGANMTIVDYVTCTGACPRSGTVANSFNGGTVTLVYDGAPFAFCSASNGTSAALGIECP